MSKKFSRSAFEKIPNSKSGSQTGVKTCVSHTTRGAFDYRSGGSKNEEEKGSELSRTYENKPVNYTVSVDLKASMRHDSGCRIVSLVTDRSLLWTLD